MYGINVRGGDTWARRLRSALKIKRTDAGE